MHVTMRYYGGPMDGSYQFEDNGDIVSCISHTQDTDLFVAMVVYYLTGGNVGRVTQRVPPAFLEELNRESIPYVMKSSGQKYEIAARQEDEAKNTVKIILMLTPPK